MSRPRPQPARALLASALFVACALVAAAAPAPPGAAQAGAATERRVAAWHELLARDERLSFTPRTEHDARVALQAPELPDAERATALMAMGCARPEALRELPTLQGAAADGPPAVRMAAVLALGELGVGVEALLEGYLGDEDPRLRGCALFALLRTDRAAARADVDRVAQGDGPDAELAQALLVGAIDADVSHPTWVGELFYELRWRAARRYGLVDGVSWKQRNLEHLLATPEFLDGLVLRAAASSPEPGARDHLLAALLEAPGEAALRAATRALPAELALLVENDLYHPPDVAAWRTMLDEIDRAGNEDDALLLLSLALERAPVTVEALRLLARAGVVEVLIGLEDEWPRLDVEERLAALEAWGALGREEVLQLLRELPDDGDARVRAGMLVARARLGDLAAEDVLLDVLGDPAHATFAPVLDAALRAADDRLVRGALVKLLAKVAGPERVRVATALALAGDAGARELLAVELREELPAGHDGARAIAALSGTAAGLYTELFRQHFPLEDDLEGNVALALALIDARDLEALVLLRRALWSDPFDRSVLAGLLVTNVAGVHALRDELARPPLDAGLRDVRRVGFALGEWGGLDEVERLMARRTEPRTQAALQGAALGALGARTQ